MADLLSFLKMILEAGFKVTSALEKADHNAEDCRRIRELLHTLSAIAKYLELEDNTMGDTTKGLEEALQRASKIVSKCERKTLVSRAFKANEIADKLRGVCIDILLNLNAVLLVNVVDIKKILTHNSSMLAKLLEICAAYPDVHLRRREMDRLVQTYLNSTDDTRSQNKNKRKTKETVVVRPEFKTEKDNAPMDSKVPRASLSDGSDKSIPVKSVIGQGGPSIVNKAHSSNPTGGDGSSKKKKKEIKRVDGPNTTRPQVKIETNNEPADRKGPRASLSVCSAKSTALKSVIGQGGPSIVYKIISRLSENMTAVTSIDGHPTKTWIVMSYEGGKVSIWDYQEKKTVMELQVNEVPGKFARLAHDISQNFKETGVPHSVCSAKFIAQGKWLVVGNGDGYIYVYACTDTKLKEAKKFRAHDNSVDLLAVHPTKPYLLSSSAHGKTIKLWDWRSDPSMDWVRIKTFDVKPTYPDGVRSLKFKPRDTNTFACVTCENKVKAGNIENSSRLTTKLMGPFEADYCFSHNHLHLMVTLSPTSAEVQILDLETRKVYHTLSLGGRKSKTICIACHPTLPILVTMLDDGTVCFWDASTYRLEQTVQITDSRALDLVFIADINDTARLVVKFESMMVIMEVNYLPMENTSQWTDGGNYG
ncbi:uncharacterized protein [Miscanthus floridulus]|uniref:uncharacterized protein isoform X2 n=1 Tax=Miscanthus floridulus TaxID=154761 RepID=UPI003457BC3D